MTEPIKLDEDPLVMAIFAIINRTVEMGIVYEDGHILDCLAYIYATWQRVNDGTRPHKLN